MAPIATTTAAPAPIASLIPIPIILPSSDSRERRGAILHRSGCFPHQPRLKPPIRLAADAPLGAILGTVEHPRRAHPAPPSAASKGLEMTAAKSRNGVVLAIALCLGALQLHASDGTAASSEPLPAGTTACEFSALARQERRARRAGPPGCAAERRTPELGRLPAIKDDKDTGFYGQDGELPEIRVIGFKDGWFLIEVRTIPNPIGRSFTPAAAGSRANSSRRICFAIL